MDHALSGQIWLLVAITIATGHRFFFCNKSISMRSTKSARSERRKSMRRFGNPVPIYLAYPDSKSEPMDGTVLDRSLGGLGISSADAFEIGTIVLLRPVKAIDLTPWCQVEVLGCQKVGSRWRLSCRFVDVTPNSVMMMFG